MLGNKRHLAPFPADLVLVLLHPDVSVDTFAAHQLKVGVATIRLQILGLINDPEVLPRIPADNWLRTRPEIRELPNIQLFWEVGRSLSQTVSSRSGFREDKTGLNLLWREP